VLERERVERGWSNQQLAAQLRCDEGTASRLRRGVYLPNRILAVRCRDLLGIDPGLWDKPVKKAAA